MTDDHPIFRALWRFNAMAIAAAACFAALAAVAVAALVVFEFLTDARRPIGVPAPESPSIEPEDSDASDADREANRVTPFQPLGRTGALYAVVTAARGGPSDALLEGSYRAKQKIAVDWLIYHPNRPDRPAEHLLGVEPSLLLDARIVELETGRDRRPELFLFVRSVTADTDGDGQLTDEDAATISIADPNGSNLAPVDIDGAFHSIAPISASEAVLFVSRREGLVAAHIDIASRQVIRETVLPRRP